MEASSVLAPLLSGEGSQVLLLFHALEAVTILANRSECSQHACHVAAAAAQSSAADMANVVGQVLHCIVVCCSF